MVIALLVCLAATVATGLSAYGVQGKGPLAVLMVTDANANGNEAGYRALAKKRGEETESTVRELHDLLANITVALVGAHIFGVVVASFVHKENLVLAMITGKKTPGRRLISDAEAQPRCRSPCQAGMSVGPRAALDFDRDVAKAREPR